MIWRPWRKKQKTSKESDALIKILQQQREALKEALKEATESRKEGSENADNA